MLGRGHRVLSNLCAIGISALLTGCGIQKAVQAPTPSHIGVSGVAHGGQQPVQNAHITLWAAGSAYPGSPSQSLLTKAVFTGPDGGFGLTDLYTCPTPAAQVYLLVQGGNPGLAPGVNNSALALMVALGRCDGLASSSFVEVNEVTTVAAVSAIAGAGFMNGATAIGDAGGSSPALTAAFTTARQLANSFTGTSPGTGVPYDASVPVALINTLANVISSCINSPGGTSGTQTVCGSLFSLIQTSGLPAPTDTISFLQQVVSSPTLNTAALYDQISPTPVFQPQLSVAPASFAVGLVYTSSLVLSPGPLQFPATYVGYFSPSIVVTAYNSGSSTITITGFPTAGLNPYPDFQTYTDCPATLSAGAGCHLWTQFSPATIGARSSFIGIASSASTFPQYVAVNGTGLWNPPSVLPVALNSTSVFIGASIVQLWPRPINNAGVYGQDTNQILARFPTAVLGHGYARVIILAGSNDVTNGYSLQGVTIPNLQTMAQEATNAGMQVVLSLLPPIHINGIDYTQKVVATNAAIRQLAVDNGYLYVDYYTPFLNNPNALPDGEHPNAAGYALMDQALAGTLHQ